jgi:hypothetical protein
LRAETFGRCFLSLPLNGFAMVPEVDDLYAEVSGEAEKTVVTKITVEKKVG